MKLSKRSIKEKSPVLKNYKKLLLKNNKPNTPKIQSAWVTPSFLEVTSENLPLIFVIVIPIKIGK